jgi:hypothetical protein
MVAAGMGVCFLPEYSATLPGVLTREVFDPVIRRQVCVVTVGGRRWSSPVAALIGAMRQYEWSPTRGDNGENAPPEPSVSAGVRSSATS